MREKALRIHKRLLAEYGAPIWRSAHAPLDELVLTILSQNTSDVNSDRAYTLLRAHYPTWEDVLAADPAALAEVIRPGGLAQIKAPRIQKALQRLREERGTLSLDFLADMEPEAARQWLLSMDGVGPKTAAIVLLFRTGRRVFLIVGG
jgi:endonuclease III